MKRQIIHIDMDKCTGCGQCVPNCPEGAIQVIEGKARLVGDLLCDGLGACLGHCPEGAIAIEERDAEPYDERRVMENIAQQGPAVIQAHLDHLRTHGQDEYFRQATAFLTEHGIPYAAPPVQRPSLAHGGCPGTQSRQMQPAPIAVDGSRRPSQLTHWPVQLHLLSPAAPQYRGSDLLLAADCTAYALGDFHKELLKNRTLAIACPKLDKDQPIYVEKLRALIDDARINTLTVAIMEVPCCSGLLRLAQDATRQAARRIPLRCVVVGIDGEIKRDDWV